MDPTNDTDGTPAWGLGARGVLKRSLAGQGLDANPDVLVRPAHAPVEYLVAYRHGDGNAPDATLVNLTDGIEDGVTTDLLGGNYSRPGGM